MSRDIYTQIFRMVKNIPTHADGPTLFKQITNNTVIASLQLSIDATSQIMTLDLT